MKGRIGDAVASPCVNLTDDGRVPWKAGSSSWDSEGVPTSRTELIKGGVASAFLYNLQYAAKDGVKSTGNCSRGMSSAARRRDDEPHLRARTESPQSLLSRVSDGMYVTEFMGLHTIRPRERRLLDRGQGTQDNKRRNHDASQRRHDRIKPA